MIMSRVLDRWEEELIKCSRCGACQNVCPVFKEIGLESVVARGKIKLIRGVRDGKLDLTDAFEERMSWCLLCKACAANCGSGVRADKLVEAARRAYVAEKGMPWLKRFIFQFGLKNRWVFHTGMRMGSLFRWVLFRRGPQGRGMLPRLPLGIDRRRLVAPLADRPLRSLYPEVITVPAARMRVAFFTGCMINYMYTDIGAAVIEVLKRNGVEVVIPSLQHCCGSPVRVSGDYESAVAMAKANIDVLLKEDYDAVVVACASCGLGLKEEYPELLAEDPVYREKAAKLAAKVKDFSELALSLGNLADGMGELKVKVTYHDPCHLNRGQKVKDQPRELIKGIPGITFQEMEQADACCGCAGSFSLYHYELSKKINDRKIDSIAATGAGLLVTGCPACRMHIEDGLHRRQVPSQAIHTAQLLEMAYRVGDREQKN